MGVNQYTIPDQEKFKKAMHMTFPYITFSTRRENNDKFDVYDFYDAENDHRTMCSLWLPFGDCVPVQNYHHIWPITGLSSNMTTRVMRLVAFINKFVVKID